MGGVGWFWRSVQSGTSRDTEQGSELEWYSSFPALKQQPMNVNPALTSMVP